MNFRRITTILTGTTSLLLMQLMAAINSPQNSLFSGNFLGELTSPAQAGQTAMTYRPPNRGAPRSTQGTGSRGCPDAGPVGLSLLAPNDHTGLTAAGHPAFFWYLSDVPAAPLEFALVQPGVAKPLFVKQMQPKQAGIVQIEMPKELPELVAGQKYKWSVSIICNANRRSADVFAHSWIERVSPAPEVMAKLATATSEQDKAEIYASAGLWYDALETTYKLSATKPNHPAFMNSLITLLEQGGLQQEAAKERQRMAMQ
ncbi:DUF928 domain-containing protein [Ancylothrix sp. C2]|nr:DUF928 domain-containing protein [Ancylothrix sp. D3o]